MFRSFSRFVSTLSASALMLGFVAFAPGALAAPSLSFNNQPDTVFNNQTEANIAFDVELSGFEQNTKVDFYVKPEGQNAFLMSSFDYLGNDIHTFTWDGSFLGEDFPPGNFEATFSGPNLSTLPHKFKVISTEPAITFDAMPAETYTLNNGNYQVTVDLDAYKEDTNVLFWVGKKGELATVVDSHDFIANGTHTFTWDGKLNGNLVTPGNYVVQLTGKDIFNNNTNTLTHEFNVLQQANDIELAFTSSPDGQYELDSNEDYEASVKLTGADNVLVTATIDGPGNIFLESDRVMDDGETFVFTWDSSDLDVLGEYVLVVEADGAMNNLSRKFEVVKAPDNSCAGYKDMKKTDEGCDAVTWAQDEGIMEGQGNGDFFDPSGIMNRAQAARISLEAFNEYNENTDYCKGKKPFPDVELGLWYSEYVCRGVAIDMITGYEAGIYAGLFKPANNVSVIEAMALFLRPLNKNMPEGCSYTGLECDEWYSGYAKYSKDKGLYPGNSLSPTKEMSRLEVAMYLYELHQDGEI